MMLQKKNTHTKRLDTDKLENGKVIESNKQHHEKKAHTHL